MKMKKVAAVILAVAIIFGSISFYNADSSTEQVKAATAWNLVWSDEFNGTSLDKNTWSYEIGNGNWGWGNGEVEYYTDRTDNVNVSDGTLQIIAKKENYGGKKYTSGRIITKGKKAFLYGKMEAKIKVENGNQDGVWPAFWMMGNNMTQGVGWPYCGEIDIMEHANSNNYVGGCLHWNTNGINGDYSHGSYGSGFEGAENSFGYFYDNENNGINGWHTYGLIWDENHMEWQLDGVTFLQQKITDNNAYCFQKEQFFLLNLAIGGTGTGFTDYKTANDATFQTTTMFVDYVRVYQLGEASQTTTAQPTTTKQAPQETVTSVSYDTVDSVALCKNVFHSYFGGANGWGTATGSISNATNTGVNVHMNSVGDNLWQVQASLQNLEYIAGNTYNYKCTIQSDVTKSVRVKVVGNDDNYIFSQDDITVTANEPYYYETQVTIPENYAGRLDLYFGLGKNHFVNESIDSNTTVNISISDMSFVTEKKIVTAIPVTTQPTMTTKGQNVTTTTKKITEPGRAVIKKVIRKKKSLKIKINKVKTAKGYQIRYSTTKSFKKYKTKNTKRLNYTIKKLKSNKKYYLKVRAYVLNEKGKKMYGRFSEVKKVRTK